MKVSTNEYWVSDESTSRKRNGVLWWDGTAQQWIGPDDTFVKGHMYRVYIDLIANNDFVFATYSDGSFDVTAYLNGERADVEDLMDETMLTVTQVFDCEAAARLPGDADLDGKVDMQDALTVVRYVRGMFPLIDMENADVNGDGKVDMNDAQLILRYDSGWGVVLQ